MTHRFPIKEIARQAGLGPATVDRAINNRAHVSPQTKARVAAAIGELEGQEAQLAARGRRMFFDFVIEAPTRFGREVKNAAEQVLPHIDAAVCRPRFLIQEIMSETEIVNAMERIGKRGSQGVCLKAQDLPAIRQSVNRLVAAGIPVVTLVTDIEAAYRSAYIGLDNHSAGRTAAYLVAKTLGDVSGSVLATRSNDRFLGEVDRETAFLQSLEQHCPNLRIVNLSGGSGVHFETSRLLNQIVDQLADLRAVYSMGGGNRAILDILDQNGLKPDIFIAHDLDRDNRALIVARRVDFVLHHDLAIDMQNVFKAFLRHHKLIDGDSTNQVSNIQIVTPENIPADGR